MKVLMVLALLVVTVWTYPVAESEPASSSVVVDYSAVAKDTDVQVPAHDSLESSESSEGSSEEKSPERKPEAVKSEKELKPAEGLLVSPTDIVKEEQANLNVQPEENLPAVIVQDLPIPSQPETVPVVEEKPVIPEAPLADKVEQAVEIPDTPIALPALTLPVSPEKEADEPKVEVAVPIAAEDDTKLEVGDVKVVEEPVNVIAPTEEIQHDIADTPIVQNSISALPTVSQVITEGSIAADTVPLPHAEVESEKKERKSDIPIETPIEVPQHEPIQPEVEVTQPIESKAEVPLAAPPAADLDIVQVPAAVETKPEEVVVQEEPQLLPTEDTLAVPVPSITEPEKPVELQVQAEPVVSQPEVSAPVDLPVAADLPKAEEIAPVVSAAVTQEVKEALVQPELPIAVNLAEVQAAPVVTAEQTIEPQQAVKDEEVPVVVPQADAIVAVAAAPIDQVVEAVKLAEVPTNILKEAQ